MCFQPHYINTGQNLELSSQKTSLKFHRIYNFPLISKISHVGDVCGFLVGKSVGPTLLNSKFIRKRQKAITKTQNFLDRFGPYTVLVGRFIPAIRPLVPFLLGITDLRLKRFYLADVIACSCWALALALLVVSVGSIFK